MIEEYHFGSISINRKIYHDDVEVRWMGEVLLWQREESHIIGIEDVKRAVEQEPEIIIIGTGQSGIAEATEAAQGFIEGKGIKLIIDRTEEAVRTFNIVCEESLEEEGEQKRVIGLFHLTC